MRLRRIVSDTPARIAAALIAVALAASCSSVPQRIAPPQLNLVSLDVLGATASGQRFGFEVTIVNPNDEPIPVVRFDYDIRLGPGGRLIGQHAMPFTLPARGSETVNVEVYSEIVASASQLMSFAVGDDNLLEYEFNGELVLDSRLREPVPLYRRGQVALGLAASAR